ncbi:MAG TPA: ferredoxin [Nitrospiria bacterium]|nr:ferredoxin [Nitrospiria bacterium]
MADQRKRLPANASGNFFVDATCINLDAVRHVGASGVSGNFFVDATCINCDTCRQLAPTTFREVDDYSAVARRPQDDAELHRAYQALLACPTGSIGADVSDAARLQNAMAAFPSHLDRGVFYCGFNSEKSFGGNSYFIRHPGGNWLIDSSGCCRATVTASTSRPPRCTRTSSVC